MILDCPLVDTTHISPPVHFVWPTCLFPYVLCFAELWIFAPPSTHFFIYFFYPTPDGRIYPIYKHAWLNWCWAENAQLQYTSIHSGHVVIWVSYPLNHIFSHSLPPSTPSPLSSCHQTITLVLLPYSSLLPPPSKTLVLPLMKPKVSSSEAPETT